MDVRRRHPGAGGHLLRRAVAGEQALHAPAGSGRRCAHGDAGVGRGLRHGQHSDGRPREV
eukprot:4268064-Prymnesium_polylepis.1